MGGSIPGKVYEPVCYSGGIPAYAIVIRKALDNFEERFDIVMSWMRVIGENERVSIARPC